MPKWGNAFPKWGLQNWVPSQPVSVGNLPTVAVPFTLSLSLIHRNARDRWCRQLLSFLSRKRSSNPEADQEGRAGTSGLRWQDRAAAKAISLQAPRVMDPKWS